MYFVYLLKSKKDGSYYIGRTSNLQRRLEQHNHGKTKSIKHKLPMKLIYFEAYANKTLAYKREVELKRNSFNKKELLDRFK